MLGGTQFLWALEPRRLLLLQWSLEPGFLPAWPSRQRQQSSGPSSSENVCMFPIGCTQYLYKSHTIHNIYTYLHYYWPHTSTWIEGQTQHVHEQKQHQWPHPVPCSGWSRWRSIRGNITTHMYNAVTPCSWALTHGLSRSYLALDLPSCWDLAHESPWTPLQLLVQTLLAQMHTQAGLAPCDPQDLWSPRQLSRSLLIPNSQLPPDLPLRTYLAPRPIHWLTG